MSLAKLHRLEDAFKAAYPREERGGEDAIKGFSFQFFEVLLATVRAWKTRDPVDRGNPSVYCETLSDIAEVKSSGVVVVTQVKYTQRSDSVTSALDNLLKVYRVCADRTPDLLAKLELTILSARPHLHDSTAPLRAGGRRSSHTTTMPYSKTSARA